MREPESRLSRFPFPRLSGWFLLRVALRRF